MIPGHTKKEPIAAQKSSSIVEMFLMIMKKPANNCQLLQIFSVEFEVETMLNLSSTRIFSCKYKVSGSRELSLNALTNALYSAFMFINYFSANPTKWSKNLKEFVDELLTSCLSVFDYFLGLPLKGLIYIR